MVLKPTAISYVFPQFRNCLNFLKWWTSLSVCIGHRWLRQTWEKTDKTEIFHVFILFFNKCIHFLSFLGGSWTCLDFSFQPLTAALDCAIFVFMFSWSIFQSQPSRTVWVWVTKHTHQLNIFLNLSCLGWTLKVLSLRRPQNCTERFLTAMVQRDGKLTQQQQNSDIFYGLLWPYC